MEILDIKPCRIVRTSVLEGTNPLRATSHSFKTVAGRMIHPYVCLRKDGIDDGYQPAIVHGNGDRAQCDGRVGKSLCIAVQSFLARTTRPLSGGRGLWRP